MVRVPVVLISVPFSCRAEVALMVPVTDKFPVVPASVSVSNVLGVALVSLIVSVALESELPRLITGPILVRASGEALDKVTVPEAAMVVAAEMAPVLLIPSLLLLIPPVTESPPADMVWAWVKVLAWFL